MSDLSSWMDVELSGMQIDRMYVKKVEKKVGQHFIRENHYSGGCGNAPMVWGLFNERVPFMVGAIAFHTPNSENVRASVFGEQHKDRVTELHRMAIIDEAPKNAASWFISRALDALKEYKPQYHAVVSFADTTEGHDGTVYQAANADYYGTSSEAIAYRDGDGRLRHSRQCGENIAPKEAKDRGWEVVEQDVKHRYVFWLPDPYQSKSELRDEAEIEMQEYPQ